MTPRDQAECDRLFENLCDTYEPETPYEEDLLRIVARERTLLGRCQNHLFGINEMTILRAEGHWDSDQTFAAQELFAKLSKAPGLIRAQLVGTPQGVALVDDCWRRLRLALDEAGSWTDDQRRMALDLLGVPLELREKGQTELDARPGQDPHAVARAVIDRELKYLHTPELAEAREELDEANRIMAASAMPMTISRETKLTRRYEAAHARRAREAMAEFLSARASSGDQDGDPPSAPREHRVSWSDLMFRKPPPTYQAPSPPKAEKPAPSAAPAAPKAPAVPSASPQAKTAGAPPTSQASGFKAKSAPDDYAQREREKERAKDKRQAQRDARKKQQKKHKQR
jgi:hypothetical protein